MTSSWKRGVVLGTLTALGLLGCKAESDTSGSGGGTTGGGGEGGSVVEPTTSGKLSLSATALDFGAADCGGEAPAEQTITITNSGDGALKWAASLDSTVYFSVKGLSDGTIEPGASAELVIRAATMPTNVDPGDLQQATLYISTDSGVSQTSIPLKASARGARFELVAPAVAQFGQSPIGVAASPIPVKVKNVGNAPAKIAVGATSNAQFSYTWDGAGEPAEVAPGASVPGLAANFTASTTNPSLATADLVVTGAVCGKSASTLSADGQGLAGIAGASPATVDFGLTDCGGTAGTRTVTVYNAGNLHFSWNAKLTSGVNYTFSPKSGVVSPGGTATVTLTPKGVGQTTNLGGNTYGDTLTITTDAPGDTPKVIDLKQGARGAILKWDATPLDFGKIAAFTSSTPKTVTVTNTGNVDAAVKVTSTGQFSSGEGVAKANGGTYAAGVVYTSNTIGDNTGTITLSSDAVLCAPLPAAVAAKGSGKSVAQETRGSLSVGGSPWRRWDFGPSNGCYIFANSGGKVACFGNNNYFQLGSTNTALTGPVFVDGLPEIVKVSSGGDFNCAVAKAGTVWCWGRNVNKNGTMLGKLGNLNVTQTAIPQQVPNITDAVDVGAGHNLACVLRSSGIVSCWGTSRRQNTGGTCCSNANPNPVDVPNSGGTKQISITSGGGCGVKTDGSAYCWGRYRRGSIGSGTSADSQTNYSNVALGGVSIVAGLTGTARISSGRCGIYNGGTVACWGCRSWSAFGDNCMNSCRGVYYSPSNAPGIGNAVDLAGWMQGMCAQLSDGTVQCWGRGDSGQVGNGSFGQFGTRQGVTGITTAKTIAAGGRAACAVLTGGEIKCWGDYGMGATALPRTLPTF